MFLETFSNICLITDATNLLVYQQQANFIRKDDTKLFQSCVFGIITSACQLTVISRNMRQTCLPVKLIHFIYERKMSKLFAKDFKKGQKELERGNFYFQPW